MALESVRILHAADALLDLPLALSVPASSSAHHILQDAPFAAFERLVESAVELEVDALLLTGNTFVEADRSLRARVALDEAFELLDEHGVHTVVVPGTLDPPSAWRSFDDLPGRVTIADTAGAAPIDLMRDGRTVATIRVGRTLADFRQGTGLSRHGRLESGRPVTIGLMAPWEPPQRGSVEMSRAIVDLPVDYLALVNCGPATTHQANNVMAHWPGPLQGRSWQQTGSHGATLVETWGDGTLRDEQFPLADVRFETVDLADAAFDSTEAAVIRMAAEVEKAPADTHEKLRIVRWHLPASPFCLSLMGNFERQQSLFSAVNDQSALSATLECLHELHIDASQLQSDLKSGSRLSSDFQRLFHEQCQQLDSIVADCCAELESGGTLAATGLEIDRQQVLAEAARLGTAWFSATRDNHD